jgi:hypothetical protein
MQGIASIPGNLNTIHIVQQYINIFIIAMTAHLIFITVCVCTHVRVCNMAMQRFFRL